MAKRGAIDGYLDRNQLYKSPLDTFLSLIFVHPIDSLQQFSRGREGVDSLSIIADKRSYED